VTIRYAVVTNENNDREICERFLEFTSVRDSSGKGLRDVILKFLKKNKLEAKHCRGQGYENVANMKGKNCGVQKRILDQNPLAFFMPRGCHNLSLVLRDAAKTSVTLFGVFGRQYFLFAASISRWRILTDIST
jgi:hypothetical protein